MGYSGQRTGPGATWDELSEVGWARCDPPGLADLLRRQNGVIGRAAALRHLSPAAVRWRLDSGRWQQPCRAVLVAQSGPLSEMQIIWVAVLWAGQGALLAGLTAARLDGLTGFTDQRVHVLLPAGRHVRSERGRLPMTVHRSRLLGPADIHPVRLPPRTRLARSLVDAAAWMATDDRARAVLAAGVQQRLVRVQDMVAVTARSARLRRRSLITGTLGDIAGGSQALSELDFSRLVRDYRIPEPDRQAARRDAQGRRRWLDALWEEARLIVEIDGFWHTDAVAWWNDMRRDNALTVRGYRVLRFPAFAVRDYPADVARQIQEALRSGTTAVPPLARRDVTPGR